jgi:hypothetical protein
MSAFQDLASPAPQVEAAEASRPSKDKSDHLKVEPARPCENTTVEAAAAVDAAVPFDDPRKFAPPVSEEKASHLSVAALRAGAGADFESKVRQSMCSHFARNGSIKWTHTVVCLLISMVGCGDQRKGRTKLFETMAALYL